MRIIDHVYADTLYKIINDIIAQIDDAENFVNDKRNEDDEYIEEVRSGISPKVEMVTPAILNLYRCFYLFIDDKVRDFVEKYKIEIPKED